MAYTKVIYNPANFSASGGMAWDVPEEKIRTYGYNIVDGEMRVYFYCFQTTCIAPAGKQLRVKIPDGRTAANATLVRCSAWSNHAQIGTMVVEKDSAWIDCYLGEYISGGTNWGVLPYCTQIWIDGQIAIPIN
jgi:hypothetical protein